MAIKRSVDDLATPRGSSQKASGWAPDPAPRFAHLLATKWHAENMEAGERPHAIGGTRFRHSDAGGCARKIAYKAAGFPKTNEMDVTGSWNTRLGTMVHDAWQAELQERYPHAQVEVTSQCFDEGSGSMDALISEQRSALDGGQSEAPWLTSFELKTVGGYAFKSAIGKIRRGTPPEGPKGDHVIQASLNALAHNADEVVIGYLAKETLSQNYDDVDDLAKFCAEWVLTRAQYEPIARLEIERIEGILTLLDEGKLAARKAPGFGGEIEDPSTSRAVKRDAVGNIIDVQMVWGGSFCAGYCSHYSGCVATEPGRVDVEITRKAWPT